MSMMRIESLGNGYVARKIIERSKDTDIIYLTDDVILDTHAVKELANTLENSISKDKIKELIIDRKQQIQENNKEIEECRKTIMEEQELKKIRLYTLHKNNDLLELEIADLFELLKGE